MNVLKELVDYCTTPVSMGALMFTGGWGSGKTYFIENDLRKALKDTHIFLRVSLYSFKSIDLVNEEIRRQWFYAYSPFAKTLEAHEEELVRGKTVLESGMDALSTVRPTAKGFKAVASVSESVIAALPISHQIKTRDAVREVVLVFDDLERTKLDMSDIMGCVNDYCENQHFKVILVAYESKIGSLEGGGMMMGVGRSSKKVYYSLKEKTIARTICYKPDTARIIHSILENRELFEEKYRQHLLKCESLIGSVCAVFSIQGDVPNAKADADQAETPERDAAGAKNGMLPRGMADGNAEETVYCGDNFRVLKCALHDFERIYHYLDVRDMDDVDRYLYHFLVYTVADRIGLITRDENGFLQSDNAVRRLCPKFNDRYLPMAIKKWILYGQWNEEDIWKEEWLFYQQREELTPGERLRTMNVMEWEETDIPGGYADMLRDAYDGKLNANEYVNLIHNSRHIRKMKLQMPQETDWQKINAGIRDYLERCEQTHEEMPEYRKLKPQMREQYSEEELTAYDLIEACGRERTVEQENAREQFLKLIREHGIRAFSLCKDIPVCVFDDEMARAAAQCFDGCSQALKMRFPVMLGDYLGSFVQKEGVEPAIYEDGLKTLLSEMEALKKRYVSEERAISAIHADAMIQSVQKMLKGTKAEDQPPQKKKRHKLEKPELPELQELPELFGEVTNALKRKPFGNA